MKNKIIFLEIVLFMACFLALYSCDKKVAKAEAKIKPVVGVCDSITFTKYIAPIILKECGAICHSAGGQSGGVKLVTYADIQAKASRIKVRINDNTNPMPNSGKMLQSRIDSIECWINNGALNN